MPKTPEGPLQAPEAQRAIWRFPVATWHADLGIGYELTDWPAGAVPVGAALAINLAGVVDVWAIVPDPEAPKVSKAFWQLATGQTYPHWMEHVATILQPDEKAPGWRWVWHIMHDPQEGLASQTWQLGRIVESKPSKGPARV